MLIRAIPYCDPVAAFSGLNSTSPSGLSVLLDSAAAQGARKGISYIAVDPYRVITATIGGVMIDGQKAACDAFKAIEQELGEIESEADAGPVPFCGGAVGYFGYELAGLLECLPPPNKDAFDLPRMVIGFYDCIAAFDHDKKQAWVLSTGRPETTTAARAHRAETRSEALAQNLAQVSTKLAELEWNKGSSWQAVRGDVEVKRRITQIIEYIFAGDIYQANFTQRWQAQRPMGINDFTLYRRLRALSPSPFAAFLHYAAGAHTEGGHSVVKNISIASASPERFISLTNRGDVEAHPIKGTRPRSANPSNDASLADELRNSVKDRAENLMIVDLLRNDISRVCALGSVEVPRLCELETFASVHHLVSVVTGKLRSSLGPLDLLRAVFPGGSVTGAPKIRAMEIIHELEEAPRNVYCGCLGWIGFDGAMDMSMVIRTLTITGDTVIAQAGGGIVADSQPEAEYEESMTKLDPLLCAVSGKRT